MRVLCELPETYEAYKKQQHRWHSGALQIMPSCYLDFQDINVEEGQHDISLLSSAKTDTSFLLIHTILHHTSISNVHTRGRITSLGGLLCPGFHVFFKCPTFSEIFPILDTIPTV